MTTTAVGPPHLHGVRSLEPSAYRRASATTRDAPHCGHVTLHGNDMREVDNGFLLNSRLPPRAP